MNWNAAEYSQGEKKKKRQKWLLLQTENSPDWKEESKNSCAGLGLAPGLEPEEVCPLPGEQVKLSKSEFHSDTSRNVLYVKNNWERIKARQNKAKGLSNALRLFQQQ